MSKRPRPYIPIAVRLDVAGRQILKANPDGWPKLMREEGETLVALLKRRLETLSPLLGGVGGPLALDHDPPLRARTYNAKTERYTPDANDPRFLIYRTVEDHKRKTNQRGDGAQYPDRVLINRERKRERKAAPVSAFKVAMAEAIEKRKDFAKRNKRPWPSRPFPRRASEWDKRKPQ